MTGVDVPLNIILHFICSLPREYTDYGGSLRTVVQNWLRSPDFGILKAINEFPRNFISYQHPVDVITCEELETWVSEAKRWVRVLFLVVEDREHFGSILKVLKVRVAKILSFLDSWWLNSVGKLLEVIGKVGNSLNPYWEFGIPVADYVDNL